MSNKLDVDDLINWLNQSEDEAKATVAESGATADPFYDGVLSAIFQIRGYIKKMRKIDDAEGKSEKQWISVDEKLPEDIDRRYFMCLVENHLEDPPMFCQYEEEYGFGFWKDIYDPVTLGFVDSSYLSRSLSSVALLWSMTFCILSFRSIFFPSPAKSF